MVPQGAAASAFRQHPDVGCAAAAVIVAAGVDCASAVASAGATRSTYGPPAILGIVAGRFHILAAGDPLGSTAAPCIALGMDRAVGLFGVLLTNFRWPVARRRASGRRSLWLAAPIVWTGLELARAHLLTGFLMASLAHTQVNWTTLIQISDLFGEYGVDFVIMMVAAGHHLLLCSPRKWFSLAACRHRHWLRTRRTAAPCSRQPNSRLEQRALVRIALIQGNSLAEWKYDPSASGKSWTSTSVSRNRQSSRQSRAATARSGRVAGDDVSHPTGHGRPGFKPPPGRHRTHRGHRLLRPSDLAALVAAAEHARARRHRSRSFPRDCNASRRIAAPAALQFGRARRPRRQIVGTYDKVHRVMFGEYIPFADWLPFLYRLTPLTGGIDAGAGAGRPRARRQVRYRPEHLLRNGDPARDPPAGRRRSRGGSMPADVLVNLTNDAWYWGSSELDMHLACGVFRAVETRTPLVIAANGGISAWIDRVGRIRAAKPAADSRT